MRVELGVFQAGVAGAAGNYKDRYRFLEPVCYRGEEKDYNPDPDSLLAEMLTVMNEFGKVEPTKFKGDLGIRKLAYMQFVVAFADQYSLPIDPNIVNAEQCISLINSLENESKTKNSTITVPEQLKIALQITKGKMAEAILALTISTRYMARGYDTKILPNIPLDHDRVDRWKRVVAPFGYQNHDNDPSGDTYHFWESVAAGLSVQESKHRKNVYESVSGEVCDWIYDQTAAATELLRYKVFSKEGDTHGTIDILGKEVGKAILEYSQNNFSTG